MIETFHEETVVDQNPKGQKGKSAFYNTMKIVSMVMCVFFALVAIIGAGTNPDPPYIYWQVLIPFLIMSILSLLAFFQFKKRRLALYASYDYTFVSGELRISRILKDIKRKGLVRISAESIEAMDKISADSFPRFESQKGVKTIIATPNLDSEEDDIYYAYYKQDGVTALIIFQPSEVLRIHIKRNSRALRTAR